MPAEKQKAPPPKSVDELKGWDKIRNQIIKHYLVVPTFLCSMIFYGCIFIVLLTLGIALLASALGNKDFKYRYDEVCQPRVNAKENCTFTFELDKDLDKPNLYYEIGNFYANHRKYVKSRSYPQLRGDSVSKGDVSDLCSPVVYNEDVPVNVSFTGKPLKPDAIAYPCGLIAKYRFTDRIALIDSSAKAIPIDSNKIAHSNDRDTKFKNHGNPGDIQWLDIENEHLMVWYQMESFPDFLKLYGKINQKMPKGSYNVTISHQWDTKQFKGEKYIYLSTTNGLGGTNVFLGAVFIAMAFVVLSIIIAIIVLEFTKGSKPQHYSIDNLKW